MIFGERRLADAEGTVLAHSLTVKGHSFRKGAVLSADDLALLRAAGVEEVTVAELEAQDVGEDEAAERVAKALAGSDIVVRRAARGRCDLEAGAHGLLKVDEVMINTANGLDEAITIATLSPFSVARKGAAVATVKIIPYGVAAASVEQIEARLADRPALSMARFGSKRVGLISTTTPGMKTSLIEKTRSILGDRLGRLDNRFAYDTVCRHYAPELAAAIADAFAHNLDILLLMGAAAISDRRDVVPEALVEAGGQVLRLGMPVEPGNLLMLGEWSGCPVIGLPGCVRSPARNGFDWVLERLIAGLSVTSDDIRCMGVGGYLKGYMETEGADK